MLLQSQTEKHQEIQLTKRILHAILQVDALQLQNFLKIRLIENLHNSHPFSSNQKITNLRLCR